MVHDVLVDLQPVARMEGGHRHELVVFGPVVGVEIRKGWLFLGRTHVGENEAISLLRRIGAVVNRLVDLAVPGLGRHLEDRAIDVVDPAVITAADALLLDDAVFERRTAVAAMTLQDSDIA